MNRFRAHSAPLSTKATKEANRIFEVAVKKQRTSSAILSEEHKNWR